MINFIISSLTVVVGLIYLTRNKRVVNCSFSQTLLLFTITVIIGVFFYKTNQVAQLSYGLYIDGYKIGASKDKTKILDTIQVVDILSNFESSFYNDEYLHKNNNCTKVEFTINAPENPDYELVSIVNERTIHNYWYWISHQHLENLGKMYGAEFYYPMVPKFVPIIIQKKDEMKKNLNGPLFRLDTLKTNLYDKDGLFKPDFKAFAGVNEKQAQAFEEAYKKKYIPNGLQKYFSSYSSVFGCDKNNLNTNMYFEAIKYGALYNFFTAADISQYVVGLTIKSDIPINEIRFKYDIPVEVSSQHADLESGTYGFGLNKNRVNDIVNHGSQKIYVKFPSMANLQLVRSFILTTALTAFFTLFLTSLLNCIIFTKRYIEEKIRYKLFHKNKQDTKKLRKSEKIFKIYRFILILIFSSLMWNLSYHVYVDEPILLTQDEYNSISVSFKWMFVISGFILIGLYIWNWSDKEKNRSTSPHPKK